MRCAHAHDAATTSGHHFYLFQLTATSLDVLGRRMMNYCKRTVRAAQDEAGQRCEGGGGVLTQVLQQLPILAAQPQAQVPALQRVLQAAQRGQRARQHPAQRCMQPYWHRSCVLCIAPSRPLCGPACMPQHCNTGRGCTHAPAARGCMHQNRRLQCRSGGRPARTKAGEQTVNILHLT